MSKKKNKFDLTHLVRAEYLREGETLFFVSDPSKTCKVAKQPNGEYKLSSVGGQILTVHSFAQQCLGTEAPDHASRWVRNQAGKTLYDLWQSDMEQAEAA